MFCIESESDVDWSSQESSEYSEPEESKSAPTYSDTETPDSKPPVS